MDCFVLGAFLPVMKIGVIFMLSFVRDERVFKLELKYFGSGESM